MILRLPFPPSVNTYWRNIKGRTLLSAKGRKYAKDVVDALWQHKAKHGAIETFGSSRLRMEITLYPKDNRRRDVDNFAKAVLDSLQKAGVYIDDSQIDDLHIMRGAPHEHPNVEVYIRSI